MEKKVLVVGGGVNGLSTGICLLEDGWNVTIYSAEFSPNTTSDVAAALWYPFLSAPIEKTDVWGSRTYDILKLLTADKNTGIEMTQTYEYFRSPQPDPTWMSTVDNFERITQGLPSDYVECFSFTTQIIEMPIYLEIDEAKTDVESQKSSILKKGEKSNSDRCYYQLNRLVRQIHLH